RCKALSLIWRTRSLVKLNFSPISSSDSGWFDPNPKNNTIISLSLSVKVDSERLISSDNDSSINELSVSGSEFSNTSNSVFSSPCTNGASIDTCLPELLNVSETLSTVVSKISANSSGEGSRSYSCSNLEKALLILLKDPTWFRGRRTIRDCSAIACKID